MNPLQRAPLTDRERRIGKRLVSRGERPMLDALLALRGTPLDDGRRLGRLFAVGGEGALFELEGGPAGGPALLGKIALVPWHKPVKLSSNVLRSKRKVIEDEAVVLGAAGSPFLPASPGLAHFDNPHVESARGGAFAEPEPCLVMERLPGHDLDKWLCRVHRGVPDRAMLRRTLDRLCVGVVQALVDLENRGYLYADLRPGNLRVVGRPERRIRLLDAGGCVPVAGDGKRFPHVPSYLPPDVFRDQGQGALRPSSSVMAVMAGRTLFEVATGLAPKAGRHLDVVRLLRSPVSAPVSEAIAGLAQGTLPHCALALQSLARRAKRRDPGRG